MAVSKFGTRLRELRKQAGMSQREVAKKVGIDFTYLSKIESGVLDPPKEDKIIKLAKVLKTNKDELITLAGKVPSDIAPILLKRGVIPLLRSSTLKDINRLLEKNERNED